jgi:prepilin-type N-terminal cleavage/methylation domain-containing protein
MLNKNFVKQNLGFPHIGKQRSVIRHRRISLRPSGNSRGFLKAGGRGKPYVRGFTLIEVIVAIFLITVGMAGAFNLVQRTIAFTSVSSSRLQAAYLAQGGIELVRNTRDSNWLAGNEWDLNLPSGTETGLLGKFDRTITITAPEPDKMVVSVEINWQERGRDHSVTAQTELYNWK